MHNITIEEIIDARLAGDWEHVSELSLGRLWQDHVRMERRSFALFTLWTGNVRDEKRLHEHLRKVIGFNRLIGHERRTDGVVQPKAWWVWVNNIGLDDAVRLVRAHRQVSLAYLGPEIHHEFQMRWFDVTTSAIISVDCQPEFDAGVVAAYYAERKLFYEYVPNGWFEGLWAAGYEQKRQQG